MEARAKSRRIGPPAPCLDGFLASSSSDVLLHFFAFIVARDAMILRTASRALCAAVSLHARGDWTPITGSLVAWRACLLLATIANVARCNDREDEELASLCGCRIVDLTGSEYLSDASLAQLHDIARLRVYASNALSPVGIELVASTGCDVSIVGFPRHLVAASIAAATARTILGPGSTVRGHVAQVEEAARAVVAQSMTAPDEYPEHATVAAFHSAGCCEALVAVLSASEIGVNLLIAACRAVVFQTGCAAGAEAFVDAGGPAALTRLMLRSEPTVALAACEALTSVQWHETDTANACVTACLESGGSAALAALLRNGKCCDDDLLAREVCRVLFFCSSSALAAVAFIEAGGVEPLLKLFDTSESRPYGGMLGDACLAIVGLLRGDGRPLAAAAIIAARGIERLLAVVKKNAPDWETVCLVLRDLQVSVVEIDQIVDAGGVDALVAHMHPSALALKNMRRRNFEPPAADILCKALLPLTERPRGRAAFEHSGGTPFLTAALAWDARLDGLASRMPHAIALGVRLGVVAPPEP